MTIEIILILAALAVYRVARMLTNEDGPADLFSKWRDLVGQTSWVGRGFHCHDCVSFWAAFAMSAILCYLRLYDWPLLIVVWPALAGASVILYRVFG